MRSTLLRFLLGFGLLYPAPAIFGADAAKLPDVIEFNRDIRPILSDNCFACHGPDKNKREAELRLDTQAGLLGDDGTGGVVLPGRTGGSELFRRITAEDETERMPPAESGKQLTPRDVALIRKWIEQGAKWEGHWSFQPLRPSHVPAPADAPAGFLQNEIDAFTLAAMRAHGLTPSPEADRRTLIRRLSFDLTGLPPTPEEVRRFLADDGADAWERLVDGYLASPHYGERMALWWLDLVRYADTVGYHGDQSVSVSPFRDYVIQSFNDNKPFDQFTIEQLAGDLLPEPTLEQRIASGYNRLGMMSAEGGVQPKEYLAKYIAERVRNFGGTWLGVTLGCCECHDHKFDPFPTKDFYSTAAFFADIQERGLYSGANADGNWGPQVQVPTAEQTRRLKDFDAQIAEVKHLLDTPTPDLAAAQAEWERTQVPWTVLRPAALTAANGTTLALQDDGSILASGASPATETYTLAVANVPMGITALRLDILPHDSLPKQGPGRGGNGNFVLTEVEATVTPAGDGAAAEPVKLQNATATYEQTSGANKHPDKKWSIASTIDSDAKGPTWGWAVMEQVGKANGAVFETAADIAGGEGTTLTLVLKHNSEHAQHTLGRFRISATTAPRPVRATDLPPAETEALLRIAADQRNEQQRNQLAAYYRTIAPLLEPSRVKLKELEQARTALDQQITTTLVTATVEPRMIRVLPRGNWMDETRDAVQPAFLQALPQTGARTDARMSRLDLAKWVVAPDNPLTARAFANRMWDLFLGSGLSRKLDDLGAQGQWPSHPELLDWLAAEFSGVADTLRVPSDVAGTLRVPSDVAGTLRVPSAGDTSNPTDKSADGTRSVPATPPRAWDVKRLVKLIVMSGTYRQSALASPPLREADPDNRWLARQARFRLDAEMVRDNALRISGLLVERMGGKSAFPYQPPGYFAYLNFPAREWQNDTGEDLYRRGLYTHWQRQYLHPALLAFDAPSREECAADRPRSNTPLQSLVLLNDPSYVEAARVFAANILREGGTTTADRLDWAFHRATARPVRPAEIEVLSALLDKHRREAAAEPESAGELLKVGAMPLDAAMDKTELVAWTSVARAILNLHEVVTRN